MSISTSGSGSPDCFLNTFEILVHFVVPEAQHPKSFTFEKFRPSSFPCGILRRSMLTAIKFDDESFLKAHEIGNVAADGLLPTKLEAGEAAIT